MSTQHPGLPPAIGWLFVDHCALFKSSKTIDRKGMEAVGIEHSSHARSENSMQLLSAFTTCIVGSALIFSSSYLVLFCSKLAGLSNLNDFQTQDTLNTRHGK
jgi:hypothetical protein